MFTGLIHEVGEVQEVSRRSGSHQLRILAPHISRQLRTGDSVSVSGVCLTALQITRTSFSADLAEETRARTTLKGLLPGASVNLELPMKAGSPLGGHIVQGHVDGVAKILSFDQITEGEDWKLTLQLPTGLKDFVVNKGSIAIEGISLTVASIVGDKVVIAIIPHTYKVTNLKTLTSGAAINVEVDVLAKYARKQEQSSPQTVTIGKLLRAGF